MKWPFRVKCQCGCLETWDYSRRLQRRERIVSRIYGGIAILLCMGGLIMLAVIDEAIVRY
jgi:hypothetical protein